MNVNTAVSMGLAIGKLLDDPDFIIDKSKVQELEDAKKAILNDSDEEDSDEETKDKEKALGALKIAIKKFS